MKINVKSLQGDEYIVEIQSDQLVSDLKASIREKANGLAIERQKLVYKGRTMQDSIAVGDYNLEDGCKVHLILQKELGGPLPSCSTPSQAATSSNVTPTTTTAISSATKPHPMETTTTTERIQSNANNMTTTATNVPFNDPNREQSRFEIILRERLNQYMGPDDVEKIMVNLHHEINADINSSSLDDLERLAKQKLNISNE